jgi:hypothetical protein
MWSGLASTIEIIEYFLSSVGCISKVLHFINLDISFIWHAFIHRYCDILEQTSAADRLRVYMQRTRFASTTHLNVRITTSEFTSRCCTPWSRLKVQHFTSIGRPS